MDEGEFEQKVGNLLSHRCYDANSARIAVLDIYSCVVDEALLAIQFEIGTVKWSQSLVKIQQTMSFTPLNLFLAELAKDRLLPVRAAAKLCLCQRGVPGFFDSEAGLMHQAILFVMAFGPITRLKREIFRNPELVSAMRLWEVSARFKIESRR